MTDRLRFWAACTFIVLCLGVGVIVAVRNTNDIKSLQSGATSNRVKNVLTWCNAINTDRDVTRSYINTFRASGINLPALKLPDLPCNRLAYDTVQSNK